jgi:hypothetical protein
MVDLDKKHPGVDHGLSEGGYHPGGNDVERGRIIGE